VSQVAAAVALPEAGGRSLLALAERGLLALRLTSAMLAAGLLVVAVVWEFAFPEQRALAELVAGAAAALVAIPVFGAAWHSLRHPSLHGVTDRLIAVALIAAWASGDLMTAAVLPIVMIIGHVLEERSLLGSQEAIRALSRLTESQARRLRPDGAVDLVAADHLRPGELIELRAGDRAPADGLVRRGAASLDMASLTGESVPVDVAEGDTVLAGSIDTNGRLEVEVTRIGAQTALGRIILLMRTAERAKPPVTRLLERYAGQYLVLVLLIAAGVWFTTSDSAAMLAVLVASCPCALVLAAPAAAIAAIAVAGRHGILIKGSAFLERLAEVTCVVFDKTGTLTTGELTLAELRADDPGEAEATLRLAAALAAASSHPVSRALARAVPPSERPAVDGVRELSGFGLTATVAAEVVVLGRPDMLAGFGVAIPEVPVHDGPIAGIACGPRFLGWLLFADRSRPESRLAIQDLAGLGLRRQVLLTGDRAAVAQRIGAELGIADVCAEALPEQKMARVLEEIRAGFRPLVVGDGINDSLALKVGAVGIAMGAQGTDVALASADLVLMTSDLRRLATCIRLSRRCRRTIGVNVAVGLGWTLVLVVLAALGALGANGAIVAALLHNLSTFVGLGNAGRLLLFDETGAAAPSATTATG
jgi:Zn2+/Cd2+-exporting ATPase